jgi:hypothetical protein
LEIPDAPPVIKTILPSRDNSPVEVGSAGVRVAILGSFTSIKWKIEFLEKGQIWGKSKIVRLHGL